MKKKKEDGIKIEIHYSPHEGQRRLHESKARFRVVAAGRRWGKTFAGIYEILSNGLSIPKASCWWVSPTYAQSMIAYRAISRALESIITYENKDERRLEVLGGTSFEFKSADKPDNLRGAGLDFLVMDEAAYIDEDVWYGILRPALADRNGRAVIISTPRGKNWFYRVYTLGFSDENYFCTTGPTRENPKVPPDEIEEARRNMPELFFRQEFLAEFIDSSSAVFSAYTECIDQDTLRGPKEGEKYFAGWDIAKRYDYSVLIVMSGTGDVVALHRLSGSYSVQMERVCDIIRLYSAMLCVDATGLGDPILDELRTRGIRVYGMKMNSESKRMLIDTLAMSFEKREIKIPPDIELLRELEAFSYDYTRSGKLKLEAKRGYKDDYVISLALANWLVARRREVGILWL